MDMLVEKQLNGFYYSLCSFKGLDYVKAGDVVKANNVFVFAYQMR